MSIKMICSQCKAELRPVKNEVTVIETAGIPPRPNRIWSADEWGCPRCGMKVITDFAKKPIAQVGEQAFDEWLRIITSGNGVIIYNHGDGAPGAEQEKPVPATAGMFNG